MSLQCIPSSLGLISISVWEMSFEKFQYGPHGSHLGCWNGTNLTVLNLHVSQMLPTKFQLNPTYCSRADVLSRFSSWPSWRPSWILERNQFSNSKSPCYPNASYQGWVHSDKRFRSRLGLKIFKMATLGAILDIGTEQFKQFWISMLLQCCPSSFSSIQLTVWKMPLKTFKMADMAYMVAILDKGTEQF